MPCGLIFREALFFEPRFSVATRPELLNRHNLPRVRMNSTILRRIDVDHTGSTPLARTLSSKLIESPLERMFELGFRGGLLVRLIIIAPG